MRVLVCDDDEASLALFQGLLECWGYEVWCVRDGEQAWNALQSPTAPRLALLDWQMPGATGLEICRRLKQGRLHQFVYVVLVTGRQGHDDLMAALDGGAHGFIRKPPEAAELRSKLLVGERIVEHESRLEAANDKLARYAAHLREEAETMAKQLVHADRLATLCTMAACVAHEINNPASFVAGNVQVFRRFWAVLEPLLAKLEQPSEELEGRLAFIRTEMPGVLQGMQQGVERITTIVTGLRRYACLDRGAPAMCSLNDCVTGAVEICRGVLRKVDVRLDLVPGLPTVEATGQQIEQVLINLLQNGADALLAQDQGGTLTVRTRADGAFVRAEVEDSGPGIPPSLLEEIWKPFFTTKDPGKGTGLGLSVSQGIISAHRGRIWAENVATGGTRFVVHLPAAHDTAHGRCG